MTSIIPIILTGDNLGKRHKQINSLVKKVYDTNEDFINIESVSEKTAIDRLFKIDLASKHRNVDYIIKNLKDSDLLFVSRALKSKWLFEHKYQDIINPEYLEGSLYPFMVTTAVTKMKHWVHLNLKDEQRSEKFYKFYCEKEFELAMKFLVKCSNEFVTKEFPKIVQKVSPKHFKLLCEKSAQVAKIFFDLVTSDESLKSRYLNDEKKFYSSIKCLLKSDTKLYLDITEKYFNVNQFERFSSIATKFIMTHHKNRFLNKPELYTAWILNVATLAENLNEKEAKDLIEKLARAQYLRSWFDFKNVESLIKRLKPADRAAFKKKVFVENDFGEKVEEWPYVPPSPPSIENLGPDIFEDRTHEPYEYKRLGMACLKKRMIRKKKGYASEIMMCDMVSCEKVKTELDKLFDEYRFVGFEKTFYELRKRILAESSSQNRQFIMLVLVSKTGGRADAIATLMELLAQHSNEPPNLRAAIIRSLVKRAFIWRLPEETWQQLMEFGQGLGLDGSPPEADCIEGLHSVFIRSLLHNKNCDAVFKAFLDQFSDLSNYDLTAAEKKCISEALPKLMLNAAKEKVEVEKAVDLISKLLEILKAYDIKVEAYPGLIPTIVDLAQKDFSSCTYLLENLFNARVGRKALFQFTYKIMKTDASHLNALKHNISVLDFDIFYESCLDSNKFDQFFRKLAIYFNENGGLAMQYKNKLKEKEINKLFVRPLAISLGSELILHLQKLDIEENVESKVFAARLRANAHLARPFHQIDIDNFGWRKAGVKMIANMIITCPDVDVEKNIKKLLESKRTARLALVLSKRNQNVTDVFIALAKQRPTIGIKTGVKLLREQGDNFDVKIWETIRPLIEEVDFRRDAKTVYVKKLLDDVIAIPIKIRPEYSITIYEKFDKLSTLESYAKMPYLCHIEHLLPNISEDFVEKLLIKFLENDFISEKITNNYDDILCNCMFIRILFTYIYLSKTEEVEKRRFETFGSKLLVRMAEIFNVFDKREIFFQYLDEILLNFKNTKVFLNPEYVSCLSTMENTVKWMQTILPIEQYFDRYVTIHLTMLYFKAIRQTVKQAPEVFENEIRKYKDAVKIVGNLFGKHIAKEIKELMAKYFESIIYLYKDALVTYLDNYFNYMPTSDFISSIIKGILEKDTDDIRLGMYILKEKYYTVGEEVVAEISKSLQSVEDPKNKFFIFSELLA